MKIFEQMRGQSIGILALFVALGGTSYAAVKLPKDSVTAVQIKTGAVASSEIKNNSVASIDIKNGSLTAADFAGGLPRGATGATGDTGAQGPQGAPGTPGANGSNGAPGTARAYALINPDNCGGGSPTNCTATYAKGITTVARTSTGLYCVTAPGLNQGSTPAIVTVEFGGTTPPQHLAAAHWLIDTGCGNGAYRVATTRNAFASVRNAADTGSTNVAGYNDSFYDGVAFVIAIP